VAEVGIIQLGNETLHILWDPEPDFGAPSRELGESSNPLAFEPVQTTDTVSSLRAQKFSVLISGVESAGESAADNKVRQIRNLAVEVAKDENTLVVQGARRDIPVTFQVKKNPPFPQPYTWRFDRGHQAVIPIELRTRPWGEGPAVTAQQVATALETPNVVDVTIDGEVPTTVDLEATRGFTGSGLQTLVVGRVDPAVELADVLHLAMDATAPNWDPYTATSGYVNASDNTRICTDTRYRAMYWPALPVGRYKLFTKCRVQRGGKGWLAQSRASNNPSAAPITLTDNDWRFVSLGDYASDGYTALRIVGKCREAANGILVDWLLPFPLDYGSPFYFHCTANSLQRVTSRWLDAQMQLTTGAWRSARRYVYGPGLLGVDNVRLLVAACDANGSIRRPSVSLAADYSPLYTHWIPKPEV